MLEIWSTTGAIRSPPKYGYNGNLTQAVLTSPLTPPGCMPSVGSIPHNEIHIMTTRDRSKYNIRLGPIQSVETQDHRPLWMRYCYIVLCTIIYNMRFTMLRLNIGIGHLQHFPRFCTRSSLRRYKFFQQSLDRLVALDITPVKIQHYVAPACSCIYIRRDRWFHSHP